MYKKILLIVTLLLLIHNLNVSSETISVVKNRKLLFTTPLKTDKIILNKKKIYTTFELSAYCNCYECSEGWNTTTASGLELKEGMVAAPSNIPLGSKIYIDGMGEYIVTDRGGYIDYTPEGYMRIDVYMESHEKALKFGRFNIEGYYIEGDGINGRK